MHLALLTNNRFPPREGIGRHIAEVARRLQVRGHRVTVLARGRAFARWSESRIDGLRVRHYPHLPLQPFHHALARTELAGWLLDGADGADLLHVHLPLLPPLPARLPVVATFHSPMLQDTATIGEPGRLAVLRQRIKPVLLRRTKDQVVKELPPKQEQVLAIELSAKHRKIYDTRLARERQKVLGLLGEWEKNRFQIFRSLTLLRQLSLHPGLVDPDAVEAGSAKVDFLIEQLDQLVAEDHSALVFSQFTGFLAILRDRLDAAGIEYSYLDGSVDARRRSGSSHPDGGGWCPRTTP